MSLIASCYCGGTRIEVAAQPQDVTECNCTFCFKRGALWAYFPPDQIVVDDAHGVGFTSDPQIYTHLYGEPVPKIVRMEGAGVGGTYTHFGPRRHRLG